MKKVLAIALLSGALVSAQSDQNAQSASSGPKPMGATSAASTTPKNAFSEEFRGNLSLTGGLNFEQQYDDNVMPTVRPGDGGTFSSFSGRFSLNSQGHHTQWQLHYAPSYRVTETGPDNNGGSHQVGTELQRDFTARTSLSASGGFALVSANNLPQQQFVFSQGRALPVFYPQLLQLNTRTLSPNGNMALTHKFTARNRMSWGVDGTANLTDRESHATVPYPIGDSYSAGASMSFDHDISPATSFGFRLQHRYLGFSGPTPHINNEVASLTFAYRIAQEWQLEAAAGPSFLIRNGDSTTSYAFNVGINRHTAHYTFGVTYNDGVQSSAIAAATTQRGLAAFVSRELGRRWSASSSFAFSQSSSEFVSGSARSWSAAGNIRYRINDQVNLAGGYSHIDQNSGGSFAPIRGFDRNVYTFGLQFDLKEIFRR